MNNLKFYISLITVIIPGYLTLAAEETAYKANNNITTCLELNEKNELFLVITNNSLKDETIATNIDYLVRFGLTGFPQKTAIQFRSNEKKNINIKDQQKSGWLYANIYNSTIDLEFKDGKFVNEAGNNGKKLLIASKSLVSYPINYTTAMRLVSTELRALKSKVSEFRIMMEIEIENSGVFGQHQIVSKWLPCEPSLGTIPSN
jgi:hypothetical protein